MSNYFIELKDISKYYSNKDIVTLGLRKVNLRFDKGEFVAVCGESGSGKSTLMNVISGMDSYEEGEMFFNGDETSCFNDKEWDEYRRQNVSFVFQDYNLIDSYTVLQNVELALMDNFPIKSIRRQRALELIDKVELTTHKGHKCTKLSGGQKQRVAIARALAKDAPILIADEPTGNLDAQTSKAIIELLAELSKDKLLLVVTHSFDDVKEYATRKIRLFDGSVAEDKVVRPKNIVEESEQEQPIEYVQTLSKGEDAIRSLKDKLSIAFNNILATPRKSLFVFTTFLMASILILTFCLSVVNVIMLSPDYNLDGDRKDTAMVFYSDRKNLEESDRDKLNNLSGVKDSMLLNEAYENDIQPMVEYTHLKGDYHFINYLKILNVSNFNKPKVEYGRLPESDDEILLSFQQYETPRLELLDKTVDFVYGRKFIYIHKGVKYDDDIYPDDLMLSYKVVGFTIGDDAYLTTKAIEEISLKVIEQRVKSTAYEIYVDEFFYNKRLDKEEVLVSSELGDLQAYLLMDKNDDPEGIIPFIPNKGLNVMFYRTSMGEYFHQGINLKIAHQDSNSEIFDEYWDGETKLLLSEYLYGGIDDLTITQGATVILDLNKNTQSTMNKLMDLGYKVVYPYNKDQGPEYKILIFFDVVTSIIMGIFLGGLATILLSSIFHRVLQTKKKDFNIFRILGMSHRDVKTISYMEFILTNVFAFTLLTITIVVLYIVGLLSSGYKLMSFMNTIFPYGLLHYSSFLLFLSTFVVLMLLTIKISSRFNRRLFNASIKKSSVDV